MEESHEVHAPRCENFSRRANPLQKTVGHFHKLEKLREGETRSRERAVDGKGEEIGGLRTILPVPPSAPTCILIRDITWTLN